MLASLKWTRLLSFVDRHYSNSFMSGSRLSAAALAPETVAGPANKNIFQGRLADGKRVNFTRKRFDHIGHETVAALALNAHLLVDHRGLHLKPGANALRQQSCVMRGFQQ